MNARTKLFAKGAAFALIASVLGLTAVLFTARPGPHVASPLFPTIFTAWKNLNPVAVIPLFAAIGFFLSLFAPEVFPFAGAGTIFLFPILATIEMIGFPKTHTLFPFEFAIYGLFGLPGVVGGAVAWLIRTRGAQRPTTWT